MSNLALRIELSKSVFTPGEQVKGWISFVVTERVKIRQLKLKLFGQAFVKWAESRSSNENKRTVLYRDNEVFVDHDLVFVNQQNVAEYFVQAGEYKYPFQYTLPLNLPSSLEKKRCYVRYWAFALVDIPWDQGVHAKEVFTVINMIDLNSLPLTIRTGLGVSDDAVIGCCSKSTIEYDISVSKTGYVPGESIPFTVNINNKSGLNCHDIKVKLIERMTLRKVKRQKVCKLIIPRDVVEVLMPQCVLPNTSHKWQGDVTIPSVVASMPENTCRVLEIDYFLKLSFEAGSMQEAHIPITVGFIPLKDESVKTPPFVYKPCESNFSDKLGDIEPGYSHQSNMKTYQPVYPFYQNISLQNDQPSSSTL